MAQEFRQSARATVALDGSATAVLDFTSDGVYEIASTSVSTSLPDGVTSATWPQASCAARVYRDTVSPVSHLGTAGSAESGSSSDTVTRMRPGSQLVCVWSGATPGAIAVLRVNGVLRSIDEYEAKL
jgi:hypothetical protein